MTQVRFLWLPSLGQSPREKTEDSVVEVPVVPLLSEVFALKATEPSCIISGALHN